MRWVARTETCNRFRRVSNEDVADIVQNGAEANFWRKYKPDDYQQLLRRLRQSCYLDESDTPLTAQNRLLKQYRTDGLVLFLGAGVSLGSGIPNWVRLSQLM